MPVVVLLFGPCGPPPVALPRIIVARKPTRTHTAMRREDNQTDTETDRHVVRQTL